MINITQASSLKLQKEIDQESASEGVCEFTNKKKNTMNYEHVLTKQSWYSHTLTIILGRV